MSTLFEPLSSAIRRQPWVTAALIFFVIVGAANYFLWLERQEVILRHEEAQHRGEAMLLALTNHSRVTADKTAVENALLLIDRNLTVEGSMAKNLGYFFQMETISHVRLSQLNQLVSQPSPEGNSFKTIPFSLRVTGSYSQIIRFLREVENGPRLLRIRTYSFTRGDPKSNSLAMDLTVELLGSK